jgi:hypothetical protein
MKQNILRSLILLIAVLPLSYLEAQTDDEEQILFYQMEPFDDSLFIRIQEELFIDPPDPKSEIIVDLRDQNNQTVSIKGSLYPILALTPESRAKIVTYPFKLNLAENIHYGSVFTRVFERMRVNKIVSPPTVTQISSSMGYVNPFLQAFGGERFGLPIKNDIGFSLGFGTPYSGPLETNFLEANIHILGVYGGAFTKIDEITEIKKDNNHNNLYTGTGFQIGYTIPFGNFFEVSYMNMLGDISETDYEKYTKYNSEDYQAKILRGSYFNWEFRYPISILASTRGKFYVARYVNELHIGFTGRELSFAGSTFDLRLDIMPKSDVRQPQYILDVLVQKVAQSWAFSAFAIGPSAVFSTNEEGKFGLISIFANLRLKVGTSL